MLSKNLLSRWLHSRLAKSAAVVGTLCSASYIFVGVTSNCAKAEIVPDETLGNEKSIVTPSPNSPTDEIDGGATRGKNLFHSFEKFNIDEGREAFFNNPDGIENIIGRVTGGSRSDILGTLGVSGTANLFLINPSGIIFGPNSQLVLAGSFVGTTANAIEFGNQGFFSALTPDAPQLLTVKPSALLFNQISNQPITVQPTATLGLFANRSLLLVGGDVNLEGGILSVPGGRVDIGGLAGSGTVGLNADGNNLSLSFSNSAALANVFLTKKAIIDVASPRFAGGDIQVRGQRVNISEGSDILANTLGSEPGGTLTINGSESVEVTGGSRLQANTQSSGKGGELNIETRKLIVRDGSQVSASVLEGASGLGGNLTIKASEVDLSGASVDGNSFSRILAQTDGAGNAGDLTIEAKRLTVEGGAFVSTSTLGSGEGGKLVVTDSDLVQLIGTSANNSSSALIASAEGSGKPGDLTIETKQLIIQDGARALTSNLGTATDGGTLTVKASESVELSGTSKNGEIRSGLLVGTPGTGIAGKLTIETPKLQVKNGAFVSARTFGEGRGGSLIINASDSIDLIGTSDDGQKPSILTTETRDRGNAGTLTVQTRKLNIEQGAKITSNSTGQGRAGEVEVQAESITLDQGKIVSETASGNGGNINLSVKDLLLLRGNSQISSTAGTAEAGGDGGNISVNAEDGFIVAIGNENSDITANAFSGKGGQVNINATGIFGIQFREQENLQTNDITASSEFGTDGTVELNTPDIDPNSGLVELATEPVDTQLAQVCTEDRNQAQSSFEITGRGGLPPLPSEALSTDAVLVDLVTLNPTSNNPDNSTIDKNINTPTPKPIVEATGWVQNEKGEILFVANSPDATPTKSLINGAPCKRNSD